MGKLAKNFISQKLFMLMNKWTSNVMGKTILRMSKEENKVNRKGKENYVMVSTVRQSCHSNNIMMEGYVMGMYGQERDLG